ncbi:MAG: radical SAM protein, partial [Elusimicrobiales bacterium]|nr:radical SAM protein [Elusimicrobiales bacterium]
MRNLKIAIFSTTDVNKAPIRSAMVKAWLDKSQYNEFIGTKIFYLNNVNLMDSNKTDIMSYSPDLCLFFSHISWDENKLAPLIEFLKQNFPKIIIAVANDSVVQISEESAGKLKFDYILRGDVIINFSKIIKDILYGKSYGGKAPLILYDNGSCNDINNIPSPIINDTADFSRYKTAQLYLSRGCSNRCSYCNIPETKLRFFSKERVLAELNSLLEKAPFLKKIIVITNDIFSKEVSDFIPVFKKVAEDKKIFFYFFTNASSRHDEKILASANSEFFYIRAGVQSFNIMSLKSVHRAGDEKSMKENLDRLRKNAPKAKIGLEF